MPISPDLANLVKPIRFLDPVPEEPCNACNRKNQQRNHDKATAAPTAFALGIVIVI